MNVEEEIRKINKEFPLGNIIENPLEFATITYVKDGVETYESIEEKVRQVNAYRERRKKLFDEKSIDNTIRLMYEHKGLHYNNPMDGKWIDKKQNE